VHVPLPEGVEAGDLLRGPCRNHAESSVGRDALSAP